MILRWLIRIAAALLVLSLLVVGAAYLFARSSVPELAGNHRVALPGLEAEVTVSFDADAVPRITAASEADAYRALGYLHARDRLFQMEMQRRVGAGRVAEISPLVAGFGLEIDRFMRALDAYGEAERSLALQPPAVVAALEAYADGVNAYLAEGPLPPEFTLLQLVPEPWVPADSLVWGALMALQLGNNLQDEIRYAALTGALPPDRAADLMPGVTDPGRPTLARAMPTDWWRRLARAVPALGPSSASNHWVVAGDATDTGAPILANDPHLGLQAPILWYLARIETPTLTVTGATVPGLPYTLLGHNGSVAWGFTTTYADTQDLFIERVDPDDPSRYLTPGGSAAFETRVESIAVAGGEPVTLTIRSTRNGPVISDIDQDLAGILDPGAEVAALAFAALRAPNTTPHGIHDLNRARTAADVLAALRHVSAPVQNILFADTAGSIGMVAAGAIPIRRDGDGLLPVPGWDGRYDWTGFIPFEDLPQTLDPPAGRLFNANNAVVGPDFPYLIAREYDEPYRAMRIEEVLDAEAVHSMAAAEALTADTVSIAAREMLPILLLQAEPISEASARALELLRSWDFRMDRDLPQPLIFHTWLSELRHALFAEHLGDLYPEAGGDVAPSRIRRILTERPVWCDRRSTAETETCSDLLAHTLLSTVERLERGYGDDPAAWRWGDNHTAPLQHQIFGRIPVLADLISIETETDGGPWTVNRGNYRTGTQGFAHVHGAGYRAIYDLADLDNSRFIIATGQSGHPLSPHYGDFVTRWADGRHRPLTTDPVADTGAALGVLYLEPGRR